MLPTNTPILSPARQDSPVCTSERIATNLRDKSAACRCIFTGLDKGEFITRCQHTFELFGCAHGRPKSEHLSALSVYANACPVLNGDSLRDWQQPDVVSGRSRGRTIARHETCLSTNSSNS
jgi:hypothetical protein